MAADKKMEYQLTVHGDLQGANVHFIPHGFLFSADGKMVADNPDAEALEAKIKPLLKDVAMISIGDGPYDKIPMLASQARAGHALGQVLRMLAEKKTSSDAELARQSGALYDVLKSAGQERLDNALALKDADPLAALDRLGRLASLFSGDELGNRANAAADA